MKIEYFDSFKGPNPYDFLSNFYLNPVILLGNSYKTGEHAFQAFKAANMIDHEWVANQKTPSLSKQAGRTIDLRPDWEAVKYDVMVAVLRAKFSKGSALADKLMATGNALLIEGTDWNDRVWGVSLPSKRGRNWLGVLLMARRAELLSGEEDTDNISRLFYISRIYMS
jgi:ribA/ribD-fused uncharacterized protein